METNLVIVESPAKAKTIARYLGKAFIVKSSIGHIRDLPAARTGAKKRREPSVVLTDASGAALPKRTQLLVSRMGVNPYHDWQAAYELLPGKERVVAELKALSKEVQQIYLATDLDREGEAIAWHLQSVIGGPVTRYRRVIFNEISKTAIQAAFASPMVLDEKKVQAQQTRRFLDRVVGFMLSPLLWEKVGRNLSAGRVQSIAIRLLVEREREIKAFRPQEYWQIHADCLTPTQELLTLQVVERSGQTVEIACEAEAQVIASSLASLALEVVEVQHKPLVNKAPAPFTTSTLQQAAHSRLHFSVKMTMVLAQRLYEAGWITYMRTDSTAVSVEAVEAARRCIAQRYGASSVPQEPSQHASGALAQEAHEAIRPVDLTLTARPSVCSEEAWRLYTLIQQQFLASQMCAARFDTTAVCVAAGEWRLKARGKVLRFLGWMAALESPKSQDPLLPPLQVGQRLSLSEVKSTQHFTRPSPRYSEATLVRELEKRGIGRPSTYAAILSTLQERGYARVESRRFFVEKLGEIVTDRLVESFATVMSYDFTAQLEGQLDQIAQGSLDWKQVLDQFFEKFQRALQQAQAPVEAGGMRLNPPLPTTLPCPACGRKMGIRIAKTGLFLGCLGYAEEASVRCTHTINLVAAPVEESSEPLAVRSCESCGAAMDLYLLPDGRRLLLCGNAPACETCVMDGQGPVIAVATTPCDLCEGSLLQRTGRFGPYAACDRCGQSRKILKNGSIAPPRHPPIPLPELPCAKAKEAYFVLREGAAGLFLAAHTFPKARETRAPTVAELLRFKDRLPAQWLFLTQAPVADPQGHPTVVRFNRKQQQLYIGSLHEGKYTKHAQYYSDGVWS